MILLKKENYNQITKINFKLFRITTFWFDFPLNAYMIKWLIMKYHINVLFQAFLSQFLIKFCIQLHVIAYFVAYLDA